MCGIAGFIDVRAPASHARIRAMTDRLRHRGPNDAGYAFIETQTGSTSMTDSTSARFDLALGHRRLSILDLTEAGRQPMASKDGRYWVVYNGEIYNYVELRNELTAAGHEFSTGTDTEVLLAAYAEWGIDCLRRFNGMWAFALWDSVRRELYLARDRFGVKPLYYSRGADWFAFGSEIKALLAFPHVPRRPNAAMIYDFLSLRLVDHTEETFFDGISRVHAAHYMVVTPAGAMRKVRYWDLEPQFAFHSDSATESVAIDRFQELFDDAVRIRLRSDVPLGTCLSGGLDSSSIAITANRLMFDELRLDRALVGEHQRTFSACFDDPRFDERRYIDQVTNQIGATPFQVFPSAERLWTDLPALVSQMDEPFHSTSQYSQFNVMRLVRDSGVTVTLDGQGADELMAGYGTYHSVLLATLLRAGHVSAAAREAADTWRMSGRGRTGPELILRTAYGLLPAGVTTPIRSVLSPYFASYSPEGRSLQVIRPELHAEHGARRESWLEKRAASMHDLGRRLYEDVFQFSLPCLLRYADRNSMAFSIESRMPLLDYRLAQHIFSLPLSMIIRSGWTKWVFRMAMNDRLPADVQWRKDKMGFVTPEGVWLREGKQHLYDALGGELASSQFLRADAVRGRLDELVHGTSEGARFTDVFRWYILEVWMREMFSSSYRSEAA